MIKSKLLDDAIWEKVEEIKALLQENGGVQEFSVFIFEDGRTTFSNSFTNAGKNKGLRIWRDSEYDHEKEGYYNF